MQLLVVTEVHKKPSATQEGPLLDTGYTAPALMGPASSRGSCSHVDDTKCQQQRDLQKKEPVKQVGMGGCRRTLTGGERCLGHRDAHLTAHGLKAESQGKPVTRDLCAITKVLCLLLRISEMI